MSMIDCKVNLDKKQDPKGDRVVLTFESVAFPPFVKRRFFDICLAGNSCLMPSGRLGETAIDIPVLVYYLPVLNP